MDLFVNCVRDGKNSSTLFFGCTATTAPNREGKSVFLFPATRRKERALYSVRVFKRDDNALVRRVPRVGGETDSEGRGEAA